MKSVYFVLLVTLCYGCSTTEKTPYSLPQASYCDSGVDIRTEFSSLSPEKHAYVITRSLQYSQHVADSMKSYLYHDMSSSIFSRVSSYTTVINHNGDINSKHHHSIASNIDLSGIKYDYRKVGDCMIGMVVMTQDDANKARQNKKLLDDLEKKEWEKIEYSIFLEDYRRHIDKFPFGAYKDIAETRINKITFYMEKHPLHWEFLKESHYDERRFDEYHRSIDYK